MRAYATIAAVLVALSEAHAEPQRLTFAEALQRAYVRNPDALVAAVEIHRARAIVEQVRAGSLPTLTATAQFTQLDSARLSQANPGLVALPATQFNGSGTAAIDLDPRRWALWSQARENVQVTRLSAAEVRRQLAVTVGQTYLALMAQRQIVTADENALHNAGAHVDYTRARLDAGNGTLLDFQRATALFNSDRALLERAQFLLVRLQEQLGILLGENAPIDVTPEGELPVAPSDPTVALDDAQRLRSDLRLSRERLTAAAKVKRESWADFIPYASASFQMFYQTPPTQTLPTDGWQLLVTVGLPIYDGGLRYGLLKERRALENEARIRLDAELRLVSADVRTAIIQHHGARTALGSSRATVVLASDE